MLTSMLAQPYHLYVERTDPSRNVARFYAMSIEATLYGDTCLTRRWGRIGTDGQMKTHLFENEGDAVRLFLELLRQKRGRGYRPKGHRRQQQRNAVDAAATTDAACRGRAAHGGAG